MRNIINLQPLSDFLLRIEFDNSAQKVFDMKPDLKLPVFSRSTMQDSLIMLL